MRDIGGCATLFVTEVKYFQFAENVLTLYKI